jgi:hypothetical protein
VGQAGQAVSRFDGETMLALQKSLKSTVNPPFTGLTQEADRLMREVDRAIDSLVYELPQGGGARKRLGLWALWDLP